jgi:integration host factor subunit alpha
MISRQARQAEFSAKTCAASFSAGSDQFPIVMALTKNDIVERLQAELGFTRSQAIEITECLLEQVKSSLETGNDVLVSGFGKFCVKKKNERKGRNPATGEEVVLAPRRVVAFRCSGSLRKRVNGG